MNCFIVTYLLAIFFATSSFINAAIQGGAALNFENLKNLAKTYVDNNAVIEKTKPSADVAYSSYPENAKRLVNSDKISADQKFIIAQLVGMDEDDLGTLTNEYVKKLNYTILLAKETLLSKEIEPYIKNAAEITALINYINADIAPEASSFQIKGQSKVREYELQSEAIENTLKINREKKKDEKLDNDKSDKGSPGGKGTPPKSGLGPKTPKVDLAALQWLNDLATFFSDEIKKRGETAQKYDALAQSIRGLAANPGSGSAVIDDIVKEIIKATGQSASDYLKYKDILGDQKYIDVLDDEFAKLFGTIKPDDVKKIFGTDYSKFQAIAPYFQEQTLRAFYNKGIGAIANEQQQKNFRKIVNLMLLKLAAVKIISKLKAAGSPADATEIYNNNLNIFAYIKKDSTLSGEITNAIKSSWTKLADAWKKLPSQDIGSMKILIELPQ